MMQSDRNDVRRTSAYYDRIVRDYDAQVDGLAGNRTLRAAFRSRVSELAGAGSTILDFGCGTGIDAAWYAARGQRVVAYDISTGMLNALRERCAREIAEGRIVPVTGGLDDLLETLQSMPPMDAIAANFAVLNHAADLEPLLARLASRLTVGGVLVSSVLNPFFGGDLRQRWWWRGALLSPWTGSIRLRGEVTTYRHFVRTIRRKARPHLVLTEVAHAGADGRWSIKASGWREAIRQQFVVVVLRKDR